MFVLVMWDEAKWQAMDVNGWKHWMSRMIFSTRKLSSPGGPMKTKKGVMQKGSYKYGRLKSGVNLGGEWWGLEECCGNLIPSPNVFSIMSPRAWSLLHILPFESWGGGDRHSLGWLKQEKSLWLFLIALGQNNRLVAAGSAAASTLFSIHESVFPLCPLINY